MKVKIVQVEGCEVSESQIKLLETSLNDLYRKRDVYKQKKS